MCALVASLGEWERRWRGDNNDDDDLMATYADDDIGLIGGSE